MNEKFNKNAKVEQLTKLFWSREEEKGLIVKDPYWKWFPAHTVKGFNFAVLKFRGFLDGDLSRWF